LEYSQEEILTRLNAAREGTVMKVLDITLVEALKERVVARMPVGPNQRQPVGYLHGGVSVVLAETVASFGSTLHIDTERQSAFGLEINANHLRPKRDGVLTATATPLHIGRTTHIWDIKITDELDKLICISRCTVAVVERPPEQPALLPQS
jgi:1,4-dihydroxy-2-naphthoyl-CoA hydrolase